MNKSSKFIIWSTIILSVLSVPAALIFLPQYVGVLTDFAKRYPVLAPAILVLWRMLAIVVPPIPGGLISISLIPVFGWFHTFIYTSIGVLVGTSICFFLARKFREPFVKRFVPLRQLHEWQDKISERTQFVSFLGIRLTTGSVMDYISYVAGLSKMRFRIFFTATLISLGSDAVLYYLGGRAFEVSAYLAIGLVVLFGLFYYVAKKLSFFKIKF